MIGAVKRDRSRSPLRNRLLLIGVLPALLLLAVAGRIGLMLSADSAGHDAYTSGQFADAGREYAQNARLNPFQRWVAPYDEGTARARAEDYAGAAARLKVALRSVPSSRDCLVRENLAEVYNQQGDHAIRSKDGSAAEEAYRAGVKVLAGTDCAERLAADLKAKLDAVRQAKPTPTPSSPPSQGSDPKQDQLQDANQQGEKSRQDDESLNDDPNSSDGYQW